MTHVDTRARVAGSLLAVLFAFACGDENSEKKDYGQITPTPTIFAFRANPATVLAGTEVTLTWSTQNAIAIAITDAADRPVPVDGLDVAHGSVVVKPTATTSYTLTATGDEGAKSPAIRTVDVVVKPAGSVPVIDTFTASPTRVLVNGKTTLSWRTSNATALTLKDDAGVAIPLGDASLADGSIDVQPMRSPTVYTLSASGGGLVATSTVSVEVDGLPRVHRFSVDPLQPVAIGGDVHLIWETSRVERVVIKDDQGNEVVNTSDASGVHEVTGLDRTTAFRLTAKGNGTEATADVLAQVGAKITEFTASPRVARLGDPIAMTWKTEGAQSVVITCPGGSSHEFSGTEAEEGRFEDLLAVRGDYVLHAKLGDVVQTWSIFVEATQAPRVRSLTADPLSLTASDDLPGKVTLSYVQAGGDTCTLYRNGVAVPGKTFTCELSGDIEVELTGTADLRLVAKNHAGEHERSVHVDVAAPVRILAFTKDPVRRLAPGGAVTLAWEITGATKVWMTRDDGATVDIPEDELKGELPTTVSTSTLFRLFAENSLGDSIPPEELWVYAGSPEILDFEVKPRVAIPGDQVTFEWTCDGGDRLELTGPGVSRVETNFDKIDHDTESIQASSTPGDLSYTLGVRTADLPEKTKTIQLMVTDGPLVRSLEASASRIDLSSYVDITWEVADDYLGNSPTLTLKDQNGDVYPLPTNHDPNSGTVRIWPAEEGRYVFTLFAETEPGARVSSEDVDPVVVDVTVTPEIVSFKADPPSAFTVDGTTPQASQLLWQTKYAADVWLFETTSTGVPVEPALLHLSLDAGDTRPELDAGRYDLLSNSTKFYLLRIANRAGVTVEKTASFLLDPPVIESFAADEVNLIAGETATLRWETKNATVAAIQPMIPALNVLGVDTERFVDISNLPDAQLLFLSGDDVFNTITFPEGFVFPFDGQFFGQVRVATNGFLSFDTSTQVASSANESLPTTKSALRHVHLAVFWDKLASQNAGMTGSVYWRFDELERAITIMWKNWSMPDPQGTYDLNFQAILHENGSFEYRYGEFSTTSRDIMAPSNILGAQATIGFQNLSGTVGHTISNGSTAALSPSANGHAWLYDPATEPTGPREPAALAAGTHTFTLRAASADSLAAKQAASIASDQVSVKVWPRPSIDSAQLLPFAPQLGESVTITWWTSEATKILVVDANDEEKVYCVSDDPNEVSSGSCRVTPSALGSHSWELRAINGFDRNYVVKEFSFQVFAPLFIDEFNVDKIHITKNETITVTWATRGANVVELYARNPITKEQLTQKELKGNLLGGKDPAGGSIQVTNIPESIELLFVVTDIYFRKEQATANVWVDAARLGDIVTTPAAQVTPGEKVTLTWSASGEGKKTMTFAPTPPPVEITGEPDAGFIDISSSGNKITRTCTSFQSGCYSLDFSKHPDLQNFTFPYFGNSATVLTAMTEGVIGLSALTSNQYVNPPTLPAGTNPNYNIALAPFWRNLQEGPGGEFRWKLESTSEGRRYLILQWSKFELQVGSTAPLDPTDNLNFQVLLWENGHIDFRYGTMQSYGNNYQAVNGAGAAMGIQFQSGGTWLAQTLKSNADLIPGDELSNRSWRFQIGAFYPNDSALVAPTESTTYRVCMFDEQSKFQECKDLRVVVVGGGDVMFSELMIAPSDSEAEWIEIRNISRDPIDLNGFMLTAGSNDNERFTIDERLILQPGDFAVLARSGNPSVHGLPVIPLVYGEDINLPDTNGEVRLRFRGSIVDLLRWTAPTTWKIEANKSLVFEPSKFARSDSANDSAANWCAAKAVYDDNGDFYGSPGTLGSGCLTANEHEYYLLDPAGVMPWIDISQTGTSLPTIWDSPFYTKPPIPLGFSLPYFDGVATAMTVTPYGMITLTPPSAVSNSNGALSNASTLNGMVAPMWDNHAQNTNNSPAIRYGVRDDHGARVMVVSWNNVAAGNSTSGANGYSNFQLQLWETGEIVFVYGDPTPPTSATATNTQIYGGSSTIGIKSIGGNLAYQVFSGTSDTNATKPLYGGRTYRLIPR